MISCSNDKTIKLWKIPELLIDNNNNAIESYCCALSLNTFHEDYIKAIAYSEKSGNLFTAGLDGRILMINLEKLLNFPKDLTSFKDLNNLGSNKSSVFSVDCDLSGDLMIASVYDDNVKF
jgi:WD40 repeat protein